MGWGLLLDWRVWVAAAFAALGFYAAVQHIGWQASRAEYAQFRADTERLAAEAKVKNAQEQARMAANATEAISDLQVRHDAIAARYDRLRKSGGGSMPACPATPGSPSPISGGPVQPDPLAGCVAALQWGEGELAKFRDLWLLDQKNASR